MIFPVINLKLLLSYTDTFSRLAKVAENSITPIILINSVSFTSWYDLVMQEGKNIEGILHKLIASQLNNCFRHIPIWSVSRTHVYHCPMRFLIQCVRHIQISSNFECGARAAALPYSTSIISSKGVKQRVSQCTKSSCLNAVTSRKWYSSEWEEKFGIFFLLRCALRNNTFPWLALFCIEKSAQFAFQKIFAPTLSRVTIKYGYRKCAIHFHYIAVSVDDAFSSGKYFNIHSFSVVWAKAKAMCRHLTCAVHVPFFSEWWIPITCKVAA